LSIDHLNDANRFNFFSVLKIMLTLLCTV